MKPLLQHRAAATACGFPLSSGVYSATTCSTTLRYSQLLKYITPHRRTLLLVVLLLLAGTAANLANPLFAGKLTEVLLAEPGAAAFPIGALLAAWLALLIVKAALSVGSSYLVGSTGARMAAELFARLIEVIAVQMHIAQGVDKFARSQSGYFGHHHRQQCVTGDIERDAEENVGASLVELTRKAIASHIKLKHQMAWRQRHLIQFPGIPSRDDQPPRFGIGADSILNPCNLVDRISVCGRP